jgi:hypothetical protein
MQGGFYNPGRAVVLAMVGCAALLTSWRGTWTATDRGIAGASALLVMWAGGVAAARGSWVDAAPASATAVAFALMLLVARRMSQPERRVAGRGVVAVGALLAAAGLWSVAAHQGPWAAPEGPLWRSAAGTTYWNATAAILVVLAMVVITWCARTPRAGLPAVTGAVLVAGAASTLSRGGAAAAVVGIACLGALGGVVALRAAVPSLVGAGVLLAGLVPSMPVASAPKPGTALLAATAAVLATVALARRMPAVSSRAIGLTAAIGAVVLAVAAVPTVATRLTLATPRWGTWQAAWATAVEHPVGGVGPGRLMLVWRDPAGVMHATALAHNEWLQLLAELGVVGVSLVVLLAVPVVRPLLEGLHSADPLPARAALAAVTAFGVASAFDFLWHLLVIPALLAFILGAAIPVEAGSEPATDRSPMPEHQGALERPHPSERNPI